MATRIVTLEDDEFDALCKHFKVIKCDVFWTSDGKFRYERKRKNPRFSVEFKDLEQQYGVVRLEEWQEGLVLWVGGEIKWRSWEKRTGGYINGYREGWEDHTKLSDNGKWGLNQTIMGIPIGKVMNILSTIDIDNPK